MIHFFKKNPSVFSVVFGVVFILAIGIVFQYVTKTEVRSFPSDYTNGLPYFLSEPPQLPETFPLAMSFRAASDNSVVGRSFDDIFENDNFVTKLFDFSELLEAQVNVRLIHSPSAVLSEQKQVLQRWPDKIVTLQEAWGGVNKDAISKGVWPGHVLYKPGTKLTAGKNVGNNSQTTQFVVDDASVLFSGTNEALQEANAVGNLGVYLTFYRVKDGKIDWDFSEYVKLIGVDLNTNTITVLRGQFGSIAKTYNATTAEIRVVSPMKFWKDQWQLNFCFESPTRLTTGESAHIWYAKLIQDKVVEAGVPGVEHDVARWTWGFPGNDNAMDCNNDTIADYGYIAGVNSFGLGGQVYLKKLRELLPNHIIQMDSTDPLNGQRGYQYPNGVQMECYPNANKFNQFSVAFQHLRSWRDRTKTSPAISYPFTKVPTTLFSHDYSLDSSGQATVNTDWRFRIGLASATLLNMPHPFASLTSADFSPNDWEVDTSNSKEVFGVFIWDEYHGGDLENNEWLGKPSGTFKQDFSDVVLKNLIPTRQWKWAISDGYNATTGGSNSSGGGLFADVSKGVDSDFPKDRLFKVKLKADYVLPFVKDTFYTIQFDARGEDSWIYNEQTWTDVPRLLAIRGLDEAYDTEKTGVLVSDDWTHFNISIMASQNMGLPEFGFSEQYGEMAIKNLRLFKGSADRYVRKFQNGLVFLNMTDHDWFVSIDSAGRVKVTGEDGVKSWWDGGKPSQSAQYGYLSGLQNPTINSGAVIGSTIYVPKHDAVFLRQISGD